MANMELSAEIKALLDDYIDKRIEQNAFVRSAVKTKKAIIVSAPSNNKVGVIYAEDVEALNRLKTGGSVTPIYLPYSSAIPSSSLTRGTIVSVWYSYGINNAIVYTLADWSV